LTPAMRSADEHPLSMADLQKIGSHFSSSEISYFGLFTLLAAALRPGPDSSLLHILEALDRIVLRRPALQRHAWIAVLNLRRS